MHESELDELEEAVGEEVFEELLASVVKLPHDPLYVRTCTNIEALLSVLSFSQIYA